MIDRFPYEINFNLLIWLSKEIYWKCPSFFKYDLQDDYVLKIASNRLNLSIFSPTSRGLY